VYDLGCGDGRIVIEAALRRGARGVGIDLDPALLDAARARAREAGVEGLVQFVLQDALAADVSAATVVTLFLSRRGNERIQARLRTGLRPGARVVSHCHPIDGWDPDRVLSVEAGGREHKVYVWTVKGAELPASLGPFVPTPMPIVHAMLDLAGAGEGDIVYDLGCGDGRIVVEAAKRGARGVGIEYDLRLCQEARERAAREGVADRVEIRHADIAASDFSDATVVMVYLLPRSNEILRSRLQALRPGTRVVAHDFPIGDWRPARVQELWLHEVEKHLVYLWRVGE
ncbi:MAG: class I SAM-dependent methyltransferase, partial [Planctomycetes bacterium]|nr:class I SAM-dependent methyltransferase [Planctomycetota bacterium]